MENIIEKLIEAITSSQNVDIRYSNIDGKEKLVVNGLEVTTDDSELKEQVASYKNIIENLDDCDFLQITDTLSENINLQVFDNLLKQESYSSEEKNTLETMIEFAKSVIYNHLINKIEKLSEIIDQL